MAYLIDTHAFLWYIDGNPHLSEEAKAVIDNRESSRYISISSLWEIAIKESLGKLALTKPFETLQEYVIANNFVLLSVAFNHLLQLKELPHHHKDPFDRLLISQAITENLSIISADQHFKAYPVNVIW
jgi:PIN domain nuclease of toxin-antitoxin system